MWLFINLDTRHGKLMINYLFLNRTTKTGVKSSIGVYLLAFDLIKPTYIKLSYLSFKKLK